MLVVVASTRVPPAVPDGVLEGDACRAVPAVALQPTSAAVAATVVQTAARVLTRSPWTDDVLRATPAPTAYVALLVGSWGDGGRGTVAP